MTNHISDKLFHLIEKIVEIKRNELESGEKSRTDLEKTGNLIEEIIDDLIWEPGTLIYFEDADFLRFAKKTVTSIWSDLDVDEMFDEMTSGGYSGLLVNMVGDYIERAKLLRPTFISINPENTDIPIYFREAMRSWLFGLNNAALILCCTILESLIKEKLLGFDVDYVYDLADRKSFKAIKQFSLGRLIHNAHEAGLIGKKEKKIASDIRYLRNDSVHKMRPVSSQQTYNAIMDTKVFVEKLLSE